MFLRPPVLNISKRARSLIQCSRKSFATCSISPLDNSTTQERKAHTKRPEQSRPRSDTRRRDVVKRKVALMLGYDGARYHGLQRNIGVETVSDVLERALHKAGAISDENFGFLEKIKWQASARTDRGVSAAGNVVSAKLLLKREEHERGDAFQCTTERVNCHLPDDVRLFGIGHITSSFSARTSCNERWYEYLLPMDALSNTNSIKSFGEILQKFEGSHSFHNFTVGVNHSLPPRAQAHRYVTKASCDLQTVSLSCLDGEDNATSSRWVRINIRGQSFMLHQIRKMISLAILTHNGTVPSDAIEKSLCKETLINIPPAPAVGLFLDCCHFAWYNERHKAVLPHSLSFSSLNSVRENFKQEHIFPSIARRAVSEAALDIFFRTAELHPIKFP